MQVEILATEALGDRSYVVHDGTDALVVDPQRDLDRVRAVLHEHGLRCAMVAETHIHNDYISGGHALARGTRAEHLVNAADPVAFERREVADGDEVTVGSMRVGVVATRSTTPGPRGDRPPGGRHRGGAGLGVRSSSTRSGYISRPPSGGALSRSSTRRGGARRASRRPWRAPSGP